jgi:hypothetical protein
MFQKKIALALKNNFEPLHMPMEIQVLALYMYKNVNRINKLMGSKLSLRNNWISRSNSNKNIQ